MTVGIPRRTLRLGLFAVTTAFFGFLSGGAAEADEGLTPPADVAADLRHDRIAFGQYPGWEKETELLARTDPPVYLLSENASDLMTPRDHLLAVRKAMGVPGTYAGLYGDHLYAVSDDIDSERRLGGESV